MQNRYDRERDRDRENDRFNQRRDEREARPYDYERDEQDRPYGERQWRAGDNASYPASYSQYQARPPYRPGGSYGQGGYSGPGSSHDQGAPPIPGSYGQGGYGQGGYHGQGGQGGYSGQSDSYPQGGYYGQGGSQRSGWGASNERRYDRSDDPRLERSLAYWSTIESSDPWRPLRGDHTEERGQRYAGMGRYYGKGPKGYVRSDDRIREDVCDRLSDDDAVDASDITVQVKDGEVTLEGQVTDRHMKRRAEDIIEAVSGVRDVTNKLRPRKSFMQELGDKFTGDDELEHRGHAGAGPRTSSSSTSTLSSGANPSH